MVGLDDRMGPFLAQLLCDAPNQPRAPVTAVPVQRDLGIRHPSEKGQELHPEMEQKCHIPRETVCYQHKNTPSFNATQAFSYCTEGNEVAPPTDQEISKEKLT